MIIRYCYVRGKEKNKNNMNSRPQSASRECLSAAGKGEIITEDATCCVFVSA